jgi:hypothetical protein
MTSNAAIVVQFTVVCDNTVGGPLRLKHACFIISDICGKVCSYTFYFLFSCNETRSMKRHNIKNSFAFLMCMLYSH